MKVILGALSRFRESGEPTVLATVLTISGSTYRKPGSQMVLTAGGAMAGLVSGGSLESDLLAIARAEVLPAGRPRLVAYSTSASEEMVWGLNLGCDGTIEVLIEPAPASSTVKSLEREVGCGTPFCLVSELEEPWRRCLVRRDGTVAVLTGSAEDAPAALDPRIRSDALILLEQGACGARTYPAGGGPGRPSSPDEAVLSGDARVFIQTVSPAPRLVVFGGGLDAPPLVQLAAAVGWAVTVVDHRPAMLIAGRFPAADALVRAAPEEAVAEAHVSAGDYCVMMTHNFTHDRVLLRALCEIRPRHIGVLGPRARTKQLLRELKAGGFEPPADSMESLASPLGLDIGGESPEEVALSAVAELQLVRYGRGGVRLKEKG